ncbi:MAG: DUF1441 family protein [Desulfobulbaceae bacterium]|nr:DUF1441 family protein [Desulfobulbaceae bacterium]
MTLQGLEGWIRRGCPCINKGGPGKPWQFDVLALMEWRYSPEEYGVEDPEKLPPRERRDWYDGERKRRDLQILDRELIPLDEFSKTYSEVIKSVAASLETLPDMLERDAGMTGAQLQTVYRVVDGLREDIYHKLGENSGD